MTEKTYEDGVRDGRLDEHSKLLEKHDERLDSHSKRIRTQERIAYLIMGGLAVIEVVPRIYAFFKSMQGAGG